MLLVKVPLVQWKQPVVVYKIPRGLTILGCVPRRIEYIWQYGTLLHARRKYAIHNK